MINITLSDGAIITIVTLNITVIKATISTQFAYQLGCLMNTGPPVF